MVSVLVGRFFASGYNRVCDFRFVDTLPETVESGVQIVVAHRVLLGASE